ncbi:hypothetical protein DP033_08025 [Escherichia coli]|nr:hypothetical protein [Escherichia coli]EFO2098517.1 hypothetical protein [Escherichia coli]
MSRPEKGEETGIVPARRIRLWTEKTTDRRYSLLFPEVRCFMVTLWVINFITLKGYLCDVNHIKIDFCDGYHIISVKTITPA